MSDKIRINKYLAECGLGSRRQCDEIIASGRVVINGKKAETGMQVAQNCENKILLDGKEIQHISQKKYYLYNKPKGAIVSRSDENGRATIYDYLKDSGVENLETLKYVGRLDLASEGALLLTNDGDLAFSLTHPKFQIKKVYFIKISRELTAEEIRRIVENGIFSDGDLLRAGALRFKFEDFGKFCYEMDLYEGKNRQVRRIFEAIGEPVIQLKRLQFATIKLGDLPSGKIRELLPQEIDGLKNKIKKNS